MKYKVTKDIFDDADHFGWDSIKNQSEFYLNREITVYNEMAIKLVIELTGSSRENARRRLVKFYVDYYKSNGL